MRKRLIFILVALFSISMCMSACEGLTNSNGDSGKCATVQCSAKTQDGTRCERKTTNCNGRCWQHQ